MTSTDLRYGSNRGVPRSEDEPLLAGRGRFTDDLRPADAAAAVFVRSPYGHAAIRALDTVAALKLPGVLAVITGADLAGAGMGPIPPAVLLPGRGGKQMVGPAMPALAQERVRYAGEPVALVVAQTAAQALDASEAIEVDYEELPAVSDLERAGEPGAPLLHPQAEGNLALDWEHGDAAAVDAMVAGVEAIVHLGGISVEGPFGPILQANIVGVYNLYEAARKHGAKRIVFASSNHVTGFYRQSETISTDRPARPDGLYGLSKAFGEDISRLYFDRYGIETACVRIGSSFPEPRDRRMLATWLSYDDLHRLITACLTTPVLGHTIIFGMSSNSVSWWDNTLAKHVGYVPQDSADAFREAVYARTPAPDLTDPVALHQGGAFVRMGPFP